MGRKGKMSVFWKVYICVMSALAVLLIAAALVLHSVLNAYEITRPRHTAEEVFNRYFLTMDLAGLMKYTSGGSQFENAEKINESFKNVYDPSSLSYFSVSSDGEENEKYAVACGNSRIAYFTLAKTDKKEKYGFRYYDIVSAELFVESYGDISVRVPDGYTLYINGLPVPDGYKVQTGVPGESAKYMPEGTQGETYSDYKITGLFFEPSVTVTAPDGRESEVTTAADPDGSSESAEAGCKYYKASVVYDEEFGQSQSEYIIKAASAYAAYMSNDAAFGSVSQYLDREAELYNRVRTVDNYWVRDHSGYSISDAGASRFYRYSDDVYSCRVTMKQTLKRSGYSDYVENIDLIFYLRKSGGKYLIYEIINNS